MEPGEAKSGPLQLAIDRTGVAQAHAIGRLLGGLPKAKAGRIVASPLGRAQRTAEIIREHFEAAPKLQSDDRLRELSLGSWDGLTYSEIAARCPGVFDGQGRYDWYFRSPDGERYDAFAARLGEWLGEQDAACALVVVTHGIVTRVLRGLYARLPRETALMLPVPQDKVFRLSNDAIEEIPVRSRDACLAPSGAAPDETLHAATDRGRSL